MNRLMQCQNKTEWDDYVLENGGHPLQLWGWGDLKAAHGWSACRLFFYDENRKLLSKNILKNNQVSLLEMPSCFQSIDFYFRVTGTKTKAVDAIVFGEMGALSREVANELSFSGVGSIKNTKPIFINPNHIFLLETLFCDTEKRVFVLDKYFSFLLAQLHSFERIKLSSVYWFVYFSKDKLSYINDFKDKVCALGLDKNVFIYEYEHPSEGYKNEGETHIDRIIKPNATYGPLRDALFERAKLKFLDETLSLGNPDKVFIRGGLDDDDFLNSDVFGAISNEVSAIVKSGVNYFVVTNKNIYVSYFGCYNKKILVDKVSFKRVLTGCKFFVKLGSWPAHPFSITEKSVDNIMMLGQEIPVYDLSNCEGVSFSYTYNRHHLNLSNSEKDSYYNKVYKSYRCENHQNFYNDFFE